MKKVCLNIACDCQCKDNFCSPNCELESAAQGTDVSECSCEHVECALDKVPVTIEDPEPESI